MCLLARQVRVVAKYSNSKGELTLRATDDVVVMCFRSRVACCLLERPSAAQSDDDLLSLAAQSLQCSTDRHADLAAADRVLTITMAQMCGLTPEQLQRQQGARERRAGRVCPLCDSPSSHRLCAQTNWLASPRRSDRRSASSATRPAVCVCVTVNRETNNRRRRLRFFWYKRRAFRTRNCWA